MDFETFKILSYRDQCKHIDVKKAPSYPLWEKAYIAKRRRDAKKYDRKFDLSSVVEEVRNFDLYMIGSTMISFYPTGKTGEYAAQIMRELNIPYNTSVGNYRGFSPCAKTLWGMLNAHQ